MNTYRRIRLMHKIANGLQKKAEEDTIVNMFNANDNANKVDELHSMLQRSTDKIKGLNKTIETINQALADSENLNEETKKQLQQSLADAETMKSVIEKQTTQIAELGKDLGISRDAFKGLSTAAGVGLGSAVGIGAGLGVNKLLGNTSLKSKIISALLGATTVGGAGAYAGNKYSDQIADAAYKANEGAKKGIKAAGDMMTSGYNATSDYIKGLLA